MTMSRLCFSLFLCLVWLGLLCLTEAVENQGGSSGSRLHRILIKRDAKELEARPKAQISVSQSKAKEFLSVFHRSKRNVWDRSRPDVQQWIQQFMYMGYDEARLETDLSYWMDQARSNDQGRQHHHDENAPMSQQDPSFYRHGANVNYDYY
ncbi:augurin isoform X1 [Labeo rohita]|uniref:Augurin isoform X1 n=1 Tax=Labeo rohita TaxID=84645 RepID=A0A498NNE3_LABRO|nr:augurin isoform X1 [Labeo rohita]RXN33445.1 augurin isoform X1 [Labeo rohita]